MKTSIISSALILFAFTQVAAQHPEWVNYTFGGDIGALAVEGDFIWVGTNIGVVRINRMTGEADSYDRLNTGLPIDDVRSIAVAKNGRKWAGRWDQGVVSFSGRGIGWGIYGGLINVLSIAIDDDQNIWAGSDAWGLEKWEYSPAAIRATSYRASNSGLPSDKVRALAIDGQSNVWIGTDAQDWPDSSVGGLAKFDGTNWQVYNTANSPLPTNRIWSLANDGKGNLWIGTYGGGLVKFTTREWTIYDTNNSGLPSNDIYAVAVDSSGNMWIATWLHGLAKFDGQNWAVYTPSNSAIPSEDIHCLAVDGDGHLWVGTSGGLVKFDGNGWTTYNTSNSLIPSKHAGPIIIDKKGEIWIATRSYYGGRRYLGGGLVKFDGENWTTYTTSNSGLRSNDVSALADDWSGNLWIGTWYGGLAKFDGTTWKVYNKFNSGMAGHEISVLAVDVYENMWIGTDDAGLTKFDGANWAVYNRSNSRLPSNRIYSINLDGSGNKWIGTDKGLAKLDGRNEWTVYNRSNSDLPSDSVLALVTDGDNGLWIGTWSGGLAKFNGADWTIYSPSNSGLPSLTVRSITIEQNGNIWVGTFPYYGDSFLPGGLAKFNGKNWTVYRYSNSGLPSDDVFSVAIDRDGNKWIGCWNGVGVYKEGGVGFSAEFTYDFNLQQNFPNPFNSATRINFSVSQSAYVKIKIYNVLGQIVNTLVSQNKEAGEHSVLWDRSNARGSKVASGIYFYELSVGQQVIRKKMLLME